MAPAGASQECTFERLWLTLTWSADAVLMVTPVLDGEVLHFSSWEIRLVRPPNGRRQSKVFEQVMRRLHTGPLPYKYALRGTWFGLPDRNRRIGRTRRPDHRPGRPRLHAVGDRPGSGYIIAMKLRTLKLKSFEDTTAAAVVSPRQRMAAVGPGGAHPGEEPLHRYPPRLWST